MELGKLELENIVDNFKIIGTINESHPYGSGHINDSYRLVNSDRTKSDYLLQRINQNVFRDVDLTMNNILKVTRHINANSENFRGSQQTLELIPTITGTNYHRDTKGNYWRVYLFKKDLKSHDFVETSEQAYEGARAFGNFLKLLSDFPVSDIGYSIPDFHNIILRLETLKSVLGKGPTKRSIMAATDIKYIFSLSDEMSRIERLRISGNIPLRVTHNDTKFNNVLFDSQGKAVCVIDLDTVMPGVVHYDFGDGIRTATSTAGEDEKDLSLIDVDMAKYEAFTSGYLDATRDILTPGEIEYLPLSGALFPYMMGVRFLTDFLNGDKYFKTEFTDHNLQRSRSQLQMTRMMIKKFPEIDKIVKSQV